MLSIHKELSKLISNNIQLDYDPTMLYPSAMWDRKSVYPKLESGFCFQPYMNDIYVEAFSIQIFNQDGDESAILRKKFYNLPNLMFQPLTVKEKVKKIEVNRKRNGYIIYNLTSVGTCERVEIGGKRIEIYEGVFYRENFRISPFRKVIKKLFALRQKYKDKKMIEFKS